MTITSISIDDETKQIIEERNINLSEFIRDEIKKRFSNLEYLENKRDELETQLKQVTDDIKAILEMQEEAKIIKNNSPEYIEFWKKTIELFETPEGRTLLEGRKNLYNNLFSKSCTKAEFWREYEMQKIKLNPTNFERGF